MVDMMSLAETENVATPEAHRVALTGHCYRMLGSPADADEAVRETFLRAWRSRAEQPASLRHRLLRTATRICLERAKERPPRVRPMELHAPGSADDPLIEYPATRWVEPIPEADALPETATPEERARLEASTRLPFVAFLQELPPRQRAALLLADVLGWSVAEIAETLEISAAAVRAALERAREAQAETPHAAEPPPVADRNELLDRFVDAFERFDMRALACLLRRDAVLCMPPWSLWLRGLESIRAWLAGRGAHWEGSRLVAARACGLPAYGHYVRGREGRLEPRSLLVLEPAGAVIGTMSFFRDDGSLFARFGLPPAP